MLRYSVVVVAFKSRRHIETLLTQLPKEIPIVVVDNSAKEEDLSDLFEGRRKLVHIDAGGNLGFARAANIGAKASFARYLVFLNPDARPRPADIDVLVDQLQADTTIAACAPALIDASGHVQVGAGGWDFKLHRVIVHAVGLHRLFPTRGIWALPKTRASIEVDWLAATCLAVDRESFLAAGGFDETFFMYQEDVALGRAFGALGKRQLLRGDVRVMHLGGESSHGQREIVLAQRQWALAADVYRRRKRPTARTILCILGTGSAARSVVYLVLGKRARAKEMSAAGWALLRFAVRGEAGSPSLPLSGSPGGGPRTGEA